MIFQRSPSGLSDRPGSSLGNFEAKSHLLRPSPSEGNISHHLQQQGQQQQQRPTVVRRPKSETNKLDFHSMKFHIILFQFSFFQLLTKKIQGTEWSCKGSESWIEWQTTSSGLVMFVFKPTGNSKFRWQTSSSTERNLQLFKWTSTRNTGFVR